VARLIQGQLRASDVCARLGGDEFALLFPQTDAAAAGRLLARLHQQLTAALRAHHWPVTVSLGGVTFPQPPDSLDGMLARAEGLMYAAKRGGKNALRCETAEPAPPTPPPAVPRAADGA
jgi:diguanylate cyclase (GGDEF)-like protein